MVEDVKRTLWNSLSVAQLVGRLQPLAGDGRVRAEAPRAAQGRSGQGAPRAATHKFDLGEFEEAVKEWTAAYELDPQAAVPLQHRQAGIRRKGEIENNVADLKRAQHFYRRFTDNDKTADVKDASHAVDVLIKKLEKK